MRNETDLHMSIKVWRIRIAQVVLTAVIVVTHVSGLGGMCVVMSTKELPTRLAFFGMRPLRRVAQLYREV